MIVLSFVLEYSCSDLSILFFNRCLDPRFRGDDVKCFRGDDAKCFRGDDGELQVTGFRGQAAE